MELNTDCGRIMVELQSLVLKIKNASSMAEGPQAAMPPSSDGSPFYYILVLFFESSYIILVFPLTQWFSTLLML